jgi:protein-tyrosine phosphatase
VLAGALVQLTAASIDGRLGRPARAAAFDLIDHSLAHLIASDAHTPDIRSIGMRAAGEAIGDEDLARWLTRDVPGAIVAGQPAPAPPATSRGRPRLRRFLRSVS